jgi:pimeloyl-ACP methyl ester carboxylesterase
MTDKKRIVTANGVDLCIDTFGDRSHQAILLIGGAAASMDWWEDEFCARLAAGKRHVIRYDFRDTGQSVSYEPGTPPYSVADLAEDGLGILDALGISRGHIVGMSMGGGIGQLLAIEHPDRVSTLTMFSTSPGGPGGPDNPDLPPMSKELEASFSEITPQPDWTDRNAAIQAFVNGERLFAGTIPIDEEHVRELAGRVFDRSINFASSMTNHWIIEGGPATRPRLGEIDLPTLILHGTDDPLLPYGHAEALAREIPGSMLVPLPGGGHQYPLPRFWPIVVPAIIQHTSGA